MERCLVREQTAVFRHISLVAVEENRWEGSKRSSRGAGTNQGSKCTEREAGEFKAHCRRKIIRPVFFTSVVEKGVIEGILLMQLLPVLNWMFLKLCTLWIYYSKLNRWIYRLYSVLYSLTSGYLKMCMVAQGQLDGTVSLLNPQKNTPCVQRQRSGLERCVPNAQ